MQRISIETPVVSGCAATECAYNHAHACQARAITVGDSQHAGCDTFWRSASPARINMVPAGIGACKMQDCRFNEGLECMADAIQVGYARNAVDCLTYSARP